MKNILFLFFIPLAFLNSESFAQGMFMQDVSGRPILSTTYENVSGSPYLSPNWVMGKVVLSNTKVYNNINLKYDEIKDEVIFQGKDGNPMVVDNVTEFKLGPHDGVTDSTTFRNGFPVYKANKATSFYEVLVDGNTKLLKKTIKIINSSREYNSATVDKNIVESVVYYLVNKKGEINLISKDKKAFLKVLSDKETELNSFISENKLNFKTEGDMTKLTIYYNGL